MTIGINGLKYEISVRKNLQTLIEQSSVPLRILDDSGGFSRNRVDLYLQNTKTDTIFPFEIKMNKNAQMGGPSIRMTEDNQIIFTEQGNSLSSSTKEQISSSITQKIDHLKIFFEKTQQLVPNTLRQNKLSVPFYTTKEAWQKLQKSGFLKSLNINIESNQKFIFDWYHNKQCYYMQIGKSGLFYLKDNPLNISVPRLNSTVNIGIRMSRSGSGTKEHPTKRRVEFRSIAKLKRFSEKSPVSLDNLTATQVLHSCLHCTGIKQS